MWLQLICNPLSSECLQPLTLSIRELQGEMRDLSCTSENYQDLSGEGTNRHRPQLAKPLGRRTLKGRNIIRIVSRCVEEINLTIPALSPQEVGGASMKEDFLLNQ